MLAVAAELLGLGEELGVRLAAVEEGDVVAAGERRFDGRAAEELRPAEHQELHGRNATVHGLWIFDEVGGEGVRCPGEVALAERGRGYARCYGEGDDNVRFVKLEPRRPRFDLGGLGRGSSACVRDEARQARAAAGAGRRGLVEGQAPAAAVSTATSRAAAA